MRRRFWRSLLWLIDRTRFRVIYKIGVWVDRADRRLLVLGWKVHDKYDPPKDGIPF